MNRFKKKDTISLGEPLPLPYKIEPPPIKREQSPQPNSQIPVGQPYERPVTTTHAETGGTDQSIDSSLKRILVGRLRRQATNTQYSSYDTHADEPARFVDSNRNASGGSAGGGARGSRVSSREHDPISENRYSHRRVDEGDHIEHHDGPALGSFNTFKMAEFASKVNRIHAKLDLVEQSFKSDFSTQPPPIADIEDKLQLISEELDEISSQLTSAAPLDSSEPGSGAPNPWTVAASQNQPSVFDELERIRNKTQLEKKRQNGRYSVQLRARGASFLTSIRSIYSSTGYVTVLGLAIVVLFFASSYFVSDLTYEYCYYFC